MREELVHRASVGELADAAVRPRSVAELRSLLTLVGARIPACVRKTEALASAVQQCLEVGVARAPFEAGAVAVRLWLIVQVPDWATRLRLAIDLQLGDVPQLVAALDAVAPDAQASRDTMPRLRVALFRACAALLKRKEEDGCVLAWAERSWTSLEFMSAEEAVTLWDERASCSPPAGASLAAVCAWLCAQDPERRALFLRCLRSVRVEPTVAASAWSLEEWCGHVLGSGIIYPEHQTRVVLAAALERICASLAPVRCEPALKGIGRSRVRPSGDGPACSKRRRSSSSGGASGRAHEREGVAA